MSDTDTSYGTAHVVDVGEVFPPTERNKLVAWGARYLAETNEDRAIRTAHLALELAGLIWKQCRFHRRRMGRWQVRLMTMAMIVECVRARQLMEEGDNHVRH